MRLIDADALIKNLNEAEDRFVGTEEAGVAITLDGAGVVRAANTFFVQVIAAAPTVDAAPVVRCRCCKHAKTAASHPQWNCNHAQSPCYRRRVRGIDYCAYGEKWTGLDGGEEE